MFLPHTGALLENALDKCETLLAIEQENDQDDDCAQDIDDDAGDDDDDEQWMIDNADEPCIKKLGRLFQCRYNRISFF